MEVSADTARCKIPQKFLPTSEGDKDPLPRALALSLLLLNDFLVFFFRPT